MGSTPLAGVPAAASVRTSSSPRRMSPHANMRRRDAPRQGEQRKRRHASRRAGLVQCNPGAPTSCALVAWDSRHGSLSVCLISFRSRSAACSGPSVLCWLLHGLFDHPATQKGSALFSFRGARFCLAPVSRWLRAVQHPPSPTSRSPNSVTMRAGHHR